MTLSGRKSLDHEKPSPTWTETNGRLTRRYGFPSGTRDTEQTELVAGYARAILDGERRSIARAISWIERQHPQARPLLTALYPHTGRAHMIGVTGAPGTGKSTLVNQIARTYRQQHDVRVGILAVDPSSPFSGGALLGDRIRMRDLSGDPGIFIRSMATRGAVGGLSRSTFDAAQILDAAGYEIILIETVGAGQDEVEIAHTAHTTVVVEAPGLGDDIQAIKAGIVEIADIFVVNKADRAGAEATVRALEFMLEIGSPHLGQAASAEGESQDQWRTPICKTIAQPVGTGPVGTGPGKTGAATGIGELVAQLDAHRAHLRTSGSLQAKECARAEASLEGLLRQELLARFLSRQPAGQIENIVSRIASRQMSLYEALDYLLDTGASPPRDTQP